MYFNNIIFAAVFTTPFCTLFVPTLSYRFSFSIFLSRLSTVTNENTFFRRIYSEPLLLRTPLPDFSMPYNVICLTCTVIAIGFGSVYNLTTRTFQIAEEKPKTLKERLLGFFLRKSKTQEEKEEKSE